MTMLSPIIWLVIVPSILLMAILFTTVGSFLWMDATARRDRLINTFGDDEAIQRYLDMFAPGDTQRERIAPRDYLSKLYDARYDNRRYAIPGLVLGGVAGISVVWTLYTVYTKVFSPTDPTWQPMPDLAMVAVAGAYMWVVVELQQRYRASDLNWQQLTAGALRFVIAIPAGYAFSAFVEDAIALPLAFMLGAFPTRTIMTMARRLTKGKLQQEDQSETRRQIETLQGINGRVAERLEDENVTTIPQLAYCDVIDLTIRTGLSFTFIVDCASQALAWLYLGEHLSKLRIYGLRGAQEIGTLIDMADGPPSALKIDPDAIMKRLAAELEVDPDGFTHMLREIAGDPYTQFLRDVWMTSDHEVTLHISALLPDPAGPDRGNEKVTIKNDGPDSVSLDGWILHNAAGKTFDLSGPVAPGSERTVTIDPTTMALHNKGDEISLVDPDGATVSVVSYLGSEVEEGKRLTF